MAEEEEVIFGIEANDLIDEELWYRDRKLLYEKICYCGDDCINQATQFGQLIETPIPLPYDERDDFVFEDNNNQQPPVVQNNQQRQEDCNQLPLKLIWHFQGGSIQQMIQILIDIQQLFDEMNLNMFEGYKEFLYINLFMKRVRHANLYKQQIVSYIRQPILGRSRHYLLVVDQYKQFMVLINRNNGRDFPKAYQKIQHNAKIESSKQAIMRIFNHQVQVKNKINQEIYNHVNLDELNVLGPYRFLEYIPLVQNNGCVKTYLFVCYVNTRILAFTPRDNNSFRKIRFVPLTEIPEDMAGYNGDFYYLLQTLLSN